MVTSQPTYGSLFSGVGGFDLGFDDAGFSCAFQVEWDPDCQQTLAYHWPDVPRWSDVQDVRGGELPYCDVLIFGSPCQDLSVAGKRAGLDGGRSSMFYEAIRIMKEMKDGAVGTLPRIAVWENVAGALHSNRGADFGVVLDQMAELGALVIEWRVLDARYFGVPQRRRRIFLVAIFDPDLAERSPDELLPLAPSRQRDSSTSKKPRKVSTSGIRDGSDSGEREGRLLVDPIRYDGVRLYDDESPTLTEKMGTGGGNVPLVLDQSEEILAFDSTMNALTAIQTDISPTLRVGSGFGIPSPPAVLQPIVFEPGALSRLNGPRFSSEVAPTLRAEMGDNRPAVLQPIPIQDGREIEKRQNGLGIGQEGDPAYTLDTTGAQAVAQPMMFHENERGELRLAEESLSITTGGGKPGQGYPALLEPTFALRKLLPIECERLMGWPDDHTLHRADGKTNRDSARYRMCGNGVATPVARWVAEQIRPLFDVSTEVG
jgi:DNA (cytosine-5)-methyltransferase 1